MMRKRVATAVSIFIGALALLLMACSQQPEVKAPASTDSPGSNVTTPVSIGKTTGPPASTQPPVMVSILDTVDPNVCSWIHAMNACFTDGQPPAGIPLGEYRGLFQMAREHLERFGIRWESVKILDVEKVDWGDASLGNPEPGMMYAQVITPGFKMSLTADGGKYIFHTSMDRVVFVGQPWRVDIRGLVIDIQKIDVQSSRKLAFDRAIGSILVEGAIEDDTTFDKARISVTDKTRIFQQERGEPTQSPSTPSTLGWYWRK